MVSSPKKGSSKKIAKKTYVYVRSSSIAPTTTTNSSSSETTANSNACWIPAILIQQNGTKDAIVSVPMYKSDQELFDIGTDSKLKFEADHRIVDLKDYDNNVLPMQNVAPNGNLEDYKDMVELPFMHEAAILYNLKLRHKREKPYTRTGDIVFAVNPYKWYNQLYTYEKRQYYSNRIVWDSTNAANNSINDDPRCTMEPHVYEVSALAYKGLLFGSSVGDEMKQDQSILVSGESGAGKTETVKICLNHIASIQRGNSLTSMDDEADRIDPVVRRVVESNPLLEAFGNAKTRRNDNSSRFGKYIQLQFQNSTSCKLVGSLCDVYLLEKNRVVSHDNMKERSFHIFYQLLASSTKCNYWEKLSGKNNESFKYIGKTNTISIEGISDSDRFDQTIAALQLVGIRDDKLQLLMQAMCIVLQLGNITFNGDNDHSNVTSISELQALSDLIGVSTKVLSNCLTSRTFTTNKEAHIVPLNMNQAKEACDAFAKEVYERSFLWLVDTINTATAASNNMNDNGYKYRTIGLLDIFGFESFPYNGFEQLCINYANEKIQQKFNQDIFANVKDEYEKEGIGLEDIYYDDNTDVLDLIEGKTGLLALLNEECVRPKGNDFDFVQKALQINKVSSSCLHVNKTDRLSFAIHHYAGIVMYTGTNFVTKNLDTLPTDLQQCMEKSTNFIIRAKIDVDEKINNNRRKSSSAPVKRQSNITAPTIWTKYKTQLSTLMRNLSQTQSRYIRCIKPNNMKKPFIMEHEPVIDQLRCAGVVAAITISRSCFPNRLPNSVVMARYSSQLENGVRNCSKDCKSLMECLLKSKETYENGKLIKAYVVGKTKTYFRAGALEYLESNRSRGQDLQAMIIQRAARGWLRNNRSRNEKKRVRQLEIERADREKLEAAKRAQQKKDLENRRKGHEKKLLSLEEKVLELERAIKVEDESSKSTISNIEKQCKVAEFAISDLEGTQSRELQERVSTIALTKAKQEKKLEQATKLIVMLKKENTKLRTRREKAIGKLRDVEDNGSNVSSMNSSLSNLCDSIGTEASVTEMRNTTLKEEHDIVYKQNQDMKKQINHVTEIYNDIAQARQEYQKGMVRIMYLVEDHIKKRALQKEIVTVAFDAENNGKTIMSDLAIETAGASLDQYSDHI